MLQNSLKTLKNSKEQHWKLWVIKSHEFASKALIYPPTLKSNIVLNVSSIRAHKTQVNKQTATTQTKHGRLEITTKIRV